MIMESNKTLNDLCLAVENAFGPGLIDGSEALDLLIGFYCQGEYSDDFKCSACGHTFRKSGPLVRFRSGLPVDCLNCKRRFSWKSGTAWEGCALRPAEIVLMLWCFGKGFQNTTIGQILRRNPTTVSKWRQKKENGDG